MSFAAPWMLLLLLPLAVAAWRLLRRGRRTGIRFSAVGRLPARAAGWRAVVASWSPFFLIASLVLLVVAAARPRTPLAHENRSVDAIAIAMTVDVSGSMAAQDLTPRGVRPSENTTRLAIVKDLFSKFVDQRPDDLIGLVTFATFREDSVPPTADHDFLLHVLRGVKVADRYAFDSTGQSIDGALNLTSMGDGISEACRLLKGLSLKSKIIILLSDGLSNTGVVTPEKAAEVAKKLGVKIYVIGIGVVPEYVEVRDGLFGSRRVRTASLTHDQKTELLGFDEEQLRQISRTTGGKYYPVGNKNSLENALEEIDKLETTRIEADAWDRWDEHFAGFLLVGAILAFVAVSLSMAVTRRPA